MSDFNLFSLNEILADVGIEKDITVSKKTVIPSWYHDKKMNDKLRSIVDETLRQFEDKLQFINNQKDMTDVAVKDVKLVRDVICENAGQTKKYLKNYKTNGYMSKVVQLIEALNLRLANVAKAQEVRYRGRSLSEKASDYDKLKADYDALLETQLREYAMSVFSEKMKATFEASKSDKDHLYEENMQLKEQLYHLQRSFDELAAKYRLLQEKSVGLSVIDGGKDNG